MDTTLICLVIPAFLGVINGSYFSFSHLHTDSLFYSKFFKAAFTVVLSLSALAIVTQAFMYTLHKSSSTTLGLFYISIAVASYSISYVSSYSLSNKLKAKYN